MPKSRRKPAYVHHRATGQARVRINGRDYYLGAYGTPASNHWFDCIVGCAVAAALQGATLAGTGANVGAAKRERVSFSELQRRRRG